MADIDWFVGELKVQIYSHAGGINRIVCTGNYNTFDKISSSRNHDKSSQDIDALHHPHRFSFRPDKEHL